MAKEIVSVADESTTRSKMPKALDTLKAVVNAAAAGDDYAAVATALGVEATDKTPAWKRIESQVKTMRKTNPRIPLLARPAGAVGQRGRRGVSFAETEALLAEAEANLDVKFVSK